MPTTEDVGVDAVCTILRGEGRALCATNTFGVQIKAVSVRRIPFDDERSAYWLHDLDTPMFLMSILGPPTMVQELTAAS